MSIYLPITINTFFFAADTLGIVFFVVRTILLFRTDDGDALIESMEKKEVDKEQNIEEKKT